MRTIRRSQPKGRSNGLWGGKYSLAIQNDLVLEILSDPRKLTGETKQLSIINQCLRHKIMSSVPGQEHVTCVILLIIQ